MAIKLHRCSGTFIKGPHPCWKAQKALDDNDLAALRCGADEVAADRRAARLAPIAHGGGEVLVGVAVRARVEGVDHGLRGGLAHLGAARRGLDRDREHDHARGLAVDEALEVGRLLARRQVGAAGQERVAGAPQGGGHARGHGARIGVVGVQRQADELALARAVDAGRDDRHVAAREGRRHGGAGARCKQAATGDRGLGHGG